MASWRTPSSRPSLLPIPLRAYDSRTGDGPLAAGRTRTIGLANGKDAGGTSMLAVPPGASAAIVTLTVTQTVGAGFVTLYSAAISRAGDEQHQLVVTGPDPVRQHTRRGGRLRVG